FLSWLCGNFHSTRIGVFFVPFFNIQQKRGVQHQLLLTFWTAPFLCSFNSSHHEVFHPQFFLQIGILGL
ncbi:hypothetical protein, partial [Paenibacillus azoreducens]|uniref:hypothetical protein n=1 Tax=Paenibacillus azoreducens TaxID=116718 RepID=UPI001BB3C8EA